MKDALEKASTAEIAIFRDFFGKAHPKVSSSGYKVTAAADASVPEAPHEASSNLPPPSALQAFEDELVDLPENEIIALIKLRVPFNEDIEVWDTFKLKNGKELLKEYMEANLPPGTAITTEDNSYVKAILQALFHSTYVEEHAIPPHEETAEISSFPIVPKMMIIFLHEIGQYHASNTENFDLEKYWSYLRESFAPVIPATPSGGKPTASDLFKNALGVVAEENQVQKMVQNMPKERYKKYLMERDNMRRSPRNPEEEHIVEGGEEQPLPPIPVEETEEGNTTVISLRSKQVSASTASEVDYSAGYATRRRTAHHFKSDEQESSSTKKPKK